MADFYLSSNQIYIWDLANSRPQKTSNGFKLPDLSFGKNNGHTISSIFPGRLTVVLGSASPIIQ
ncbi:hypothetical protein KSD_73370 [Ktedonobacter sp. SOSP1-85]|uniref:hypothetical protein n=1 Tax=Ktedonobacter sp. SOSP1-85 TaxID=2778367 RepID=UPI001916C78E|nr:hypothetical protein [Ktedonobacter sp. SOSP1-85]GHO79566.1 hypothetical protein KSD_73370 [Ktedonobacter sp. SOSP1-85]